MCCDDEWTPIGTIVERMVRELASAGGAELGPMPLPAVDHHHRQALERSLHLIDGTYRRQARRHPETGAFFPRADTIACGRWVRSFASDDQAGISAARHSACAELEGDAVSPAVTPLLVATTAPAGVASGAELNCGAATGGAGGHPIAAPALADDPPGIGRADDAEGGHGVVLEMVREKGGDRGRPQFVFREEQTVAVRMTVTAGSARLAFRP
jgi:hypothetical protein